MSKIALLQLATLPLSQSRLDYYLKICKDKGANLVVLGEYVLNSFFKELETAQPNIIKQQSEEKKQTLCELSKKYDITIIAPIIMPLKSGFIKCMAKFENAQVKFTKQQILMPYSHWNEAKFFANKSEKLNFLTFKYENLKIGVAFGFEAHFDVTFLNLMSKKIDVLLLPTASTFESNKRWEELLKMRAFTNNIYILRVNRIGSYKPKPKCQSGDEIWKFYGDSFVVSPFGEIANRLGNDEGILIANIDKKELLNAKATWCFSVLSGKILC
ncbi:carbon-nitrogen hydrolase family protein [Campylobacter mucosalis]|uniref:Hydrolase, carbon-nitrogen family n=1 Tax=Campylobacter mucosalis CCUG 21559 TaxID=1032067 RepID=A0A6G5QGD2_9BACT|nr:carbon-nitrogen hydrolase family protein [Campylobacter mucosalis]QCD44730.1 hydrolase, carbon-nitrogen family [Campylobacter mucosalis CCUG 21559]